MASDIMKYLPDIKKLLQQHFVQQAYLFGSTVKGNTHAQSDVDILVRFTPELDYETYANNYFNLFTRPAKSSQKKRRPGSEETLSNPYLIQDINMHKFAIL